MQRSIGVCFCWSDLEKRRKAIDLFVQRQLEVVDGIPKKVFYECGATPTNCKYNVTAVRNETTGHFELSELGEHSHPIRVNISSGFLVDQINPSCTQSLTQTATSSNKPIELPSSDDQSKIPAQDEKPPTKETTKDQKAGSEASKRKYSLKPKGVLPPKKLAKLTQNDTKMRDSSTESLKSEMTSTTNSSDVLWKSRRKLPPRAAKKSLNDAEKRASLTLLMSPCEPMTRSRARTLLNNTSPKPAKKIVSAPKKSVEEKSKPSTNRGVKRCLVSSSSSASEKSLKFASSSSASIIPNSIESSPEKILAKKQPEVDLLSCSSDDSDHINSLSTNDCPVSFRSSRFVWNRIATVFGDDALLKFQQVNNMRRYKHLIWKCNLGRSKEYQDNCQYMMRVIPKKDSNSNVYYVYFSGVHNSSCKKHQNEEPKNSKNLKKTASSEHFEKKEDKKQIPSSSKRKAAIKATRKISDQNIKKKKGKSLPLIDLDSTESEDAEKVKNSQKPKENSIESDDEPAAIFIERKFNSPAPLENTSKALNSQPDHQDNKKDDSVLIIQSPASNPLNATSPHIITSTPITSSTSSNNNTQNPSFTSSTIRLNPAPIITLTPSETPRRKKSLENDNSAQTLIMLDNSPTVDLPKDWHFKLESVFIQMDQLAEDLHLKFTSKGSNLAVFSSKERSQTGQVLVLTDQVEDEIFVKVAEYGDWKLISEERWPKASVRQFLYAVRGKLIEFFFVIPNDSISGGSEVNSPVENNDGKSLISGTTATSSSLQFKRESDEDRSTIVSFEGDFIGKDKDGNLEISIQRINRKKVDDNISMPSDSLPSE